MTAAEQPPTASPASAELHKTRGRLHRVLQRLAQRPLAASSEQPAAPAMTAAQQLTSPPSQATPEQQTSTALPSTKGLLHRVLLKLAQRPLSASTEQPVSTLPWLQPSTHPRAGQVIPEQQTSTELPKSRGLVYRVLQKLAQRPLTPSTEQSMTPAVTAAQHLPPPSQATKQQTSTQPLSSTLLPQIMQRSRGLVQKLVRWVQKLASLLQACHRRVRQCLRGHSFFSPAHVPCI